MGYGDTSLLHSVGRLRFPLGVAIEQPEFVSFRESQFELLAVDESFPVTFGVPERLPFSESQCISEFQSVGFSIGESERFSFGESKQQSVEFTFVESLIESLIESLVESVCESQSVDFSVVEFLREP
jgi:hypothetical protein